MNERLGTLIEGYRTNTWLIRRHAEGLTDEGCLRQPAFEVITFNWVLGHIVGHRDHGAGGAGGGAGVGGRRSPCTGKTRRR